MTLVRKLSKIFFVYSFILLLTLFVASFAFAWTEPQNTPPICHAGQAGCDTPINVSSVYQNKLGDFGIGGGAGQLVYKLSNVGETLKLVDG